MHKPPAQRQAPRRRWTTGRAAPLRGERRGNAAPPTPNHQDQAVHRKPMTVEEASCRWTFSATTYLFRRPDRTRVGAVPARRPPGAHRSRRLGVRSVASGPEQVPPVDSPNGPLQEDPERRRGPQAQAARDDRARVNVRARDGAALGCRARRATVEFRQRLAEGEDRRPDAGVRGPCAARREASWASGTSTSGSWVAPACTSAGSPR